MGSVFVGTIVIDTTKFTDNIYRSALF